MTKKEKRKNTRRGKKKKKMTMMMNGLHRCNTGRPAEEHTIGAGIAAYGNLYIYK